MATRQLLGTLCRQWTAESGQAVELESVGGVDAARRIDGGECFDVVVLSSDALDKLTSSGRIGRITALAVSGVAVAASLGTEPRIATVAELLGMLRSSRAIGYSTGPSGQALLAMLKTWNAFESLQSRLVQAPSGVPVGELIAQGTVDLGFQQHSELIHCQGIALLGPMPPGAEISTTFAAAPCLSGDETAQADAFIAYLASAACAHAIRTEGMQPASQPRNFS